MSQQNLNRARDENQNVRKFVLPELELLFSQIAGTNFMVATIKLVPAICENKSSNSGNTNFLTF